MFIPEYLCILPAKEFANYSPRRHYLGFRVHTVSSPFLTYWRYEQIRWLNGGGASSYHDASIDRHIGHVNVPVGMSN